MTDPEAALNPVNEFLVEHIGIDGSVARQDDEGMLHVDVPPIDEDSALFVFDRTNFKKFYSLCADAGRVAIDIKMKVLVMPHTVLSG